MTATLSEHWQKIAFIAALCERHYPNYVLYCEALDQEADSAVYRKVLGKIWEYLAGQLTSHKNLEKALLKVQEITPHEPTEEDGYGIYPALDACLLLTSALQMTLDDSIDDSETAAGLSQSTVAQFIAMLKDRDSFDPAMEQHELYEQELQCQQWLLESLSCASSAPSAVKSLRRELREFDCSNLGIALPD
jgi:uncharacterized protein YjaG (DUF416 family)